MPFSVGWENTLLTVSKKAAPISYFKHLIRYFHLKLKRLQKETHMYWSTDFSTSVIRQLNGEKEKLFNKFCWNKYTAIWGEVDIDFYFTLYIKIK